MNKLSCHKRPCNVFVCFNYEARAPGGVKKTCFNCYDCPYTRRNVVQMKMVFSKWRSNKNHRELVTIKYCRRENISCTQMDKNSLPVPVGSITRSRNTLGRCLGYNNIAYHLCFQPTRDPICCMCASERTLLVVSFKNAARTEDALF